MSGEDRRQSHLENNQKKEEIIMKSTLFITGAAGFIGHETCKEAVKAGWQVTALVHSVKSAETLREIGARPVVGDVHQPLAWIAEAQDATAFIDLMQPKLPKHLGQKEIEAMSAERLDMTRSMLDALRGLPADKRPLFIAVSGADDLQPDAQNVIRHDSALRAQPQGFGHIVDGMAALAVTDVVGRTFLAMDGADTTQRMLLDATADAMGVKRPGSVPAWLAARVAGSIGVETMTLDVHADNSALLKTDFYFTYPSYREGVPATLAHMGYTSVEASVT